MAQPGDSESYRPRVRSDIDFKEKPDIESGTIDGNTATDEDRADVLRLFQTFQNQNERDEEINVDFDPTWPTLLGKQCFVARDRNAAVDHHAPIVGMIHLDLRTRRDGKKEGTLSAFVVDAGYKGMGIGAPLLDRAIDAARAAGAMELVLDTDEFTSAEAKQMYERRGFKAEVWRTKTIRGVTYQRDTYRLVLS